MPHPKQKHSYSRTHKRRAHHALKPVQTVACSHCQEQKLPHTVCSDCGYYGDRNVLGVAEKTKRREERRAQRRLRQLERERAASNEQGESKQAGEASA